MVVALTALGCGGPEHEPPEPIDPQRVQDQDDMTWDDYRPTVRR
jgi:hypothetical protein